QLRQVLVGAYHRDRVALRAVAMRQRADDVVGLEAFAAVVGNADSTAEFAAARKLVFQFRRRGVAVGLVGGIQAFAVGIGLGNIEGAGNVAGLGLAHQLEQKIAEAEDGIGGPPVAIEYARVID